MLTDALGKPVQYITDLILNLLNINYTNNVVANEHFLDNMYRIVSYSHPDQIHRLTSIPRLVVVGQMERETITT